MKSRSGVLLILTIAMGILIDSSNSMPSVNTGGGGASFTKVEYPKSKTYQVNNSVWSYKVYFTVYNKNCSVDTSGRARFFFKFYQNGEPWWNEYNDTTYRTWQCNIGFQVRLRYIINIPIWQGPDTFDFKIELYWDYDDTPYLQDTTSFTVACVLFTHLFPFQLTVFSYLCVYLFITIFLILYFWTTRPFKLWV